MKLVLIFALFWSLSSIIHASTFGTSWGNGKQVATSAGSQENPQFIPDGNNGAIVVWQDKRSGNYDIYAQRIDGDGNRLWYNLENDDYNGVVIYSGSGNQTFPQIITDNTGGIIIAWYDTRLGNYGVYAQKIDSSGSIQWDTNGVVITSDTNEQSDFQIVSVDTGGLYAAWVDRREDNSGDVYAQKISTDGVAQWTENGIGIDTGFWTQELPRIISDGNGDLIITWYSEWPTQSAVAMSSFFTQKIDSEGVMLWGDGVLGHNGTKYGNGVIVTSSNVNQYSESVVGDGFGGIFIAWKEDWRRDDETHCQNNPEIFVQHFDSDGNALWGENDVAITNLAKFRYDTKIALDGEGGILILWKDARRNEDIACNGGGFLTVLDIYAQRVSSEGNVLWQENGIAVNALDTIDDSWWDLKLLGDGTLVVGWDANHIQRLDSNGNLLWDNLRLTTNFFGNRLKITGDDTGNIFATWQYGWDPVKVRIQKLTTVYQIQDLPDSLEAQDPSRDVNVEDGSQYGMINSSATIRIIDADNNVVLAEALVDLTFDRSWPDVTGASNPVSGKSFVHGLGDADGVESTFDLYIPRNTNAADLYICPGATSLEEVTEDCNGKISKSIGDADVSVATINGNEFFKVAGVTGTGGGNENVPTAPVEGLFAIDASGGPYLYNVVPSDGSVLYALQLSSVYGEIDGGNGLAIDPTSNNIYAVLRYSSESKSVRHLVTIDPSTGEVTEIGDLHDSFSAIAFDSNGNLYGQTGFGATTPQTLYSIDKDTAEKTEMMLLDNGDGGQTLAFNPIDGLLYHASGSVFESVNLDTLEITNITLNGDSWGNSPSALAVDTSTLDEMGNPLFYVYGYPNTLLTVDVNGNVNEINGDTDFDIKGLAFRTVESEPEPTPGITITPVTTTTPEVTTTPTPNPTVRPIIVYHSRVNETPTPTLTLTPTGTVTITNLPQTGSTKLLILGPDNLPLKNTSVSIDEKTYTTDGSGNIDANSLNEGNHTITITIGGQKYSQEFVLNGQTSNVLTINLGQQAIDYTPYIIGIILLILIGIGIYFFTKRNKE